MRRFFLLFSLVAIVFIISIVAMQEKSLKTNAEVLSNLKVEWGIRRNDNNEQPDLGKLNKELMNKYSGICMGNNEEKKVYLTFDEGYEAGFTEKILDILKENEVKAAFFITGHYLNTKPQLVERMINEGHIVGNHIPTSLMSFI